MLATLPPSSRPSDPASGATSSTSAVADRQPDIPTEELLSLRASEARFRALTALTREGLMIHADGIVQDVNPAMVELLGYDSASQLIGQQAFSLIEFTSDSLLRVREHMQRGSEATYDVTFKCRDGRFRHAETCGKGIEYLGKPARIVYMHDIATRKATEDALRASESRFRRLFDGAADAMYLHDEAGRIVDVNAAACEDIGYSREELLALKVPDIEVGQPRESLGLSWDKVRLGRERSIEGRHRRSDGTVFPVEVNIILLELAGKQLFLATARDITERKAAEAESAAWRHRHDVLTRAAGTLCTTSPRIKP